MSTTVPITQPFLTDDEPLDEWGPDPEAVVGYGQPPVLPLDEEMNQHCRYNLWPLGVRDRI